MAGYEVNQVADLAAGSTLNRIHMPDNPWPGTAQKIRKLPLCGAVKRNRRAVYYRRRVGLTTTTFPPITTIPTRRALCSMLPVTP